MKKESDYNNRSLRVFLGIHEVCGHNINLEKGLRSLGIKCDFYCVVKSSFYQSNSKPGKLVGLWRRFYELNSITSRKNLIKKILYAGSLRIINILFILSKVIFYDVLIFSYGIIITNSRLELLFYKLLRKKIIFVFFGSDSRPPYIAAKYSNEKIAINFEDLLTKTKMQKNKINKIEKYADYCINWGPTAHFHEKRFINTMSLGFPVGIESKNTYEKNSSVVRILHVPSDSAIKGTEYILEILDYLTKEGVNFDLKLLRNVPNETVLDAIEKCDFIIDCQFSDTPLGILGIEAALLGKPTVVGGYLYKDIKKYSSCYANDVPALYVHPYEMKAGIKKMILDSDFRNDLSRKAFNFAKKRYNLKTVSNNYLRVINNDIPNDWWFDPYDINYIHGSISADRLNEISSEYISKFGIGALQLSDKPKLEKKFLELLKLDLKSK